MINLILDFIITILLTHTSILRIKLFVYRYASEGIKASFDWAYKGATEGTVLEGWQDTKIFF